MAHQVAAHLSLEEVQAKYRQETDGRMKIRWLAVSFFLKKWSIHRISKELSVSVPTLYTWLARWNQAGPSGFVFRQGAGGGQAAQLTDAQWQEIIQYIRDKSMTLHDVRDYIEQTYQVCYTYAHVWQVLRKQYRVRYGKPFPLHEKQPEDAAEQLKKSC